LAGDAAQRLLDWLTPLAAGSIRLPDFGDELLNQMFTRAMQRIAENRLIEADHLLGVLRDAGGSVPELLCELTRVRVLLGDPKAREEVLALEEIGRRRGRADLLALGLSFQAYLHELGGDLDAAVSASTDAVQLAESHGLYEIGVECMLLAAAQLAKSFDSRAQAMLSRATLFADRQGNRELLIRAYETATQLAGLSNDWVAARIHSRRAISLQQQVGGIALPPARGSTASMLRELGHHSSSADASLAAFRGAELSGHRVELCEAACAAMHACHSAWQLHDAVRTFERLNTVWEAEDRPLMRVARDVWGRGIFLAAVGRYEEALQCIAGAREASGGLPIGRGWCDVIRARVLLQARRFGELRSLASNLLRKSSARDDPRYRLWIEFLAAFADWCTLDEDRALDRLHGLVRMLPMCELHAFASFDAAWIHFERDEIEQAQLLIRPLQTWLSESGPGLLIQARLRYAQGDWKAALHFQNRFTQRFADVQRPFHLELTEAYLALRNGQRLPLPRLPMPLCLHCGFTNEALAKVPLELGGRGSSLERSEAITLKASS
jgi:tetratricopeptide (TPR) repeat protein